MRLPLLPWQSWEAVFLHGWEVQQKILDEHHRKLITILSFMNFRK